MRTEFAGEPAPGADAARRRSVAVDVGAGSTTGVHRPVRVLLFSTLFPSAARPGHGLFVETRLRHLVRTGAVDASVVAPVPWFPSTRATYGRYAAFARTPAFELRDGVEIAHPRYLLPPAIGMTLAPASLALGAMRSVSRLVERGFDFDVIDAHYCYPDGVAAALLARRFRKPYVITARGSDLNLIAGYRAPRVMMQWAARGAAANVAVSGALAEILSSWGIGRERIHVLRNGVDGQLFHPIDRDEARRGLAVDGAPVLLCVGHLVDVKRHRLVIDALAALLPTFPSATLLIVGDGPLRGSLEQKAAGLGILDRVRFAGARPQAELATWYSAADILVLASEREGWPNVVLEALACGTPVVASSVGGLPEILTDPALGTLVEVADPAAFAAAIVAELKRPASRAALRTHAESMGWESTSAAQLRLFRQAIETSKGDSHA